MLTSFTINAIIIIAIFVNYAFLLPAELGIKPIHNNNNSSSNNNISDHSLYGNCYCYYYYYSLPSNGNREGL